MKLEVKVLSYDKLISQEFIKSLKDGMNGFKCPTSQLMYKNIIMMNPDFILDCTNFRIVVKLNGINNTWHILGNLKEKNNEYIFDFNDQFINYLNYSKALKKEIISILNHINNINEPELNYIATITDNENCIKPLIFTI